MKTVAADHLIFEVKADGAHLDQALHVCRHLVGCFGVSAFEVDRDRQFHRLDDAQRDPQDQVQWDCLTVAIALGGGDRPAARRNGLGAGFGDGLGSAGVPDVVEHERATWDMEVGKVPGAFSLGHDPISLWLVCRFARSLFLRGRGAAAGSAPGMKALEAKRYQGVCRCAADSGGV